MKKKLLACLLALIMLLGMLPMTALAAGDTPLAEEVTTTTIANISGISAGGEVEGAGTESVTVTFDKSASLNWADADTDLGRSAGYHAGIKMTVPEALKTSVSDNKISLGNNKYATYRKTAQWWTVESKAAPANEDAWTDWMDIELDGTDYMEFWGLVNTNYFGVYGDTENGELYYHYQFDWDGDRTADQNVVIIVTKDAKLMKNGEQVWPMDVSTAGVEEITESADINANDSNNAINVEVTLSEGAELAWAKANAGIGRGTDGWWIGIKAIAPKAVNDNTTLEAVKYRNNGTATDAEKSFKNNNDGKITGGDYNDQYYIQLWGGITEDIIKDFTAAGKTKLTYTWYFNWDGKNTGETISAAMFNAEGATDMVGVDQIITLTFDLAKIKVLKGEDGSVVWEYKPEVETTVGEDGKATVDSTAAIGAIAAVSGDETVGSSKTATIAVKTEDSDTKAKVEIPADVFAVANTVANGDEENDIEASTPELKLAIDAGAVGSVTLDANAIKMVSTGAGDVEDAKVNISIEQKEKPSGETSIDKIVEVKVEDDSATNLLPPSSATTNGKITITVPAPAGAENPGVWYGTLKEGTFTPLENMKAKLSEDGETLTFTTSHLSVYAVYADDTAVEAAKGTAYGADDVKAANLTAVADKTAPAFGHAENYSASIGDDGKTITINATNLERTTNTNGTTAYWVGLALKKQVDFTYAKGFGEKPAVLNYESLTTEQTVTVDGVDGTYVTTYWGANSTFAGKTGWLSVKDADGKVVDYTVEFNVTEKVPTIVKAPIAHNGETDLEELGNVAVGEVTGNAGTYSFTLTGANIVAHKNANGAEGYWVGFGMPIDGATGTDYTYTLKGATDEDDQLITTVPGRVITEGGKSYNTIYFDEAGTYTVVQKKNDAVVATYVATVEISKAEAEITVVPAPIVGHPDNVTEVKDGLGSVKAKATANAEPNTYNVTLTGTDIVKHKNAQGTDGYWVGFGMPIENGKTYTYTNKANGTETALPSVPSRVITVEGKSYNTVYFDAEGTYTILQKEGSNTTTYIVKVTMTTAGAVYAADDIKAANLTAVDGAAAPAYGHATSYSVDYDKENKTITINAAGLEKTKNPENVEAYWVGLALKQNADYTYAKGFGTKPATVADSEYGDLTTVQDTNYVTTYWGFSSGKSIANNKTGWLSVKDADENVVDYTVNFVVAEEVPTVVAAPIVGHDGGTEITGVGTAEVGTVTGKEGTYSFTLTGNDVVKHKNAQGTEGTWVGFGMPIDNATGTGYSYKVNSEDVTTIAGRVYTVDGANYNTVYVDTAGTYTVEQSKDGKVVASYVVTVVINVKPATPYAADDIKAANLTYAEGKEAPAYGHATSYSVDYDKENKTITINAAGLEKTVNAEETEAYWVGLALKKNEGYTYASGFGAMPETVVDNEYETLTTEQTVAVGETDVTYVTTYWGTNSSFTGKTGWLAVKDENGSVVKYTVNFNVSLKSSDGPTGGGGGGGVAANVTVSSVTGGKVSVSNNNAKTGDTVTITTTPNTGKKVDTVTVTDSKGNTVTVTDIGDGKYTFVMPEGKVTVKVTFADDSGETAEKPVFTDVPADEYYADAVAWAVEKGITNGTSETTFSPAAPCTRAQIVTFLWRAAGSPKAEGSNPFADVSEGDYYYDAVLWAVEKGITNGTSDTTFSPDDTCTRGQTVTFLYRYAGQPEATASNPFTDVAADEYYTSAVLWAVEKGVTNGTSETTFSPANTCTRGQIVTFLYRGLAE